MTLPNIVASIVGMEGSGKTSFYTSAPKPIAVLSSDTNTEFTLRKELGMSDDEDFDEDVVRYKHVPLPALAFDDRDDVKEEAIETWESMKEFLMPMVKDKSERPRTLALDTASDIFDIRVMSIFGKVDQIPPEVRRNMMGQANTSYKGIISALKDRGVNVLLVHRAKEKWIDKQQRTNRGTEDVRTRLTGPFDMERDGFKGTGFITSVEINLAFDVEREVSAKLKPAAALAARYGMKIVRCTQRPGAIGKEYWGRERLSDGSRIRRASFPFLMSQIFPKIDIDEWR